MKKIAFSFSVLLIFSVPWEGNNSDILGLGTLSKTVGILGALFWVLTILISHKIRKPSVFQTTFFILIVWNVLSITWSIDIQETVKKLPTYIQLIGLVYLIWDLYETPRSIKIGLQAYVLGAWVSVSNSIYNYLSGKGAYMHGNAKLYHSRFAADGIDPNNMGIILAIGIPIAWYLIVFSELIPKYNQWLKLANLAYIPAALFGIFLTGSRGSLFTAMTSFIFILGSLKRLSVTARVVIIMVSIAAAVAIQPFIPETSLQRLGAFQDEIAEGDLNGRVEIWQQGGQALLEQPLLGVGSNAFRSSVEVGKLAHNTYLSILVELGLVGFFLLAVLLTVAVYSAMRHPKADRSFWLTLLMVLGLGISTLNWGHRKITWLISSLVVASAHATETQIAQKPKAQLILEKSSDKCSLHNLDSA